MGKTNLILLFLASILMMDCSNEVADIEQRLVGKYQIENNYGKGYVLLKEDFTVEHSFYSIEEDSTFLENSKWYYEFIENEQVYKVSINDWYWRYTPLKHIKPDEIRGVTLVYEMENDLLTLLPDKGSIDPLLDFKKELK